ncbi:Predicted epimerase, PhzC/PhzF homolog [Streptomyces sp. SceaMP-e96]|nr:Predicted epimerase, PhzC/PhzF homolog [Streptomyces sp. SceaMP-e96]
MTVAFRPLTARPCPPLPALLFTVRMTDLEVLRVFCGPDGAGGNALGVVRDGSALPGAEARAALAAELGFSETVFLDDASRGTVDIHTPSIRLPFAGHPLVGLAWLLRGLGRPPRTLRPPAGEVAVAFEGDLTWVRGRAEWVPARTTRRRGRRHAASSPVRIPTAPSPWGDGYAAPRRTPGRPRLRKGPTSRRPKAVDAVRGGAALYALSGNCSPSSRKTALFSRKARLHSSTTRCFSSSSTGSASSSARYSRLKAAGLAMSSKT